jgi:hypothetical protein
LSRCFVEKEFPAGKILMQEGAPIKTVYLIKHGECQIYSNKNPLVFSFNKDKIGNHAFIDLNEANKDKNNKNLFALGTRQSDMVN